LAQLIEQETRVNGLRLLAFTYEDILRLDTLPLHHRDPFDRIIIAQTFAGGFQLVTGDAAFPAYGVPISGRALLAGNRRLRHGRRGLQAPANVAYHPIWGRVDRPI
jgi:hypothetical protein